MMRAVIGCAAALASAAVCAVLAVSAQPAGKPVLRRAEWVKRGIVMASNMEALSFIRRRGGQAEYMAEEWHKDHTEAAILALKRQGINAVMINLHKGAGLKAEAEDIEEARRYVELAHRQGLKVGGYIGGSIFYETLFAEEPDAVNWVQRDEYGRPIYYTDTQTFRMMPDRNHPGYREFMRRVLKLGIADLKMDFIHFDQLMWWRVPYSSYTKLDDEMFRDYVRGKYSREDMKLRFGYPEMPGLELPRFGPVAAPLTGFSEIRNPSLQEMALFKASSLAARYGEYDEYIHTFNPNAMLMGNPTMDLESNNGLVYGVDLAQLMQHGDMLSSEDGNEPHWTDDGRLITRIRTYKAGRALGQSIVCWQQDPRVLGQPAIQHLKGTPALRLAEALAYNDRNLGFVAGLDVGNEPLPADAQRYVDFFWKQEPLLTNTRPLADVAVLRSFASVEFNAPKVIPVVTLFEQSLIQAQLPFGLIYDRHLSDLSPYKVVVLANQDALSDRQVEALRRYVQRGGGLVATDSSSLMNHWRQRRRQFGLADVLGMDEPPPEGAANTPVRHNFGKGRVVYIPRVEPAVAPPRAAFHFRFPNSYWKLPRNHADLIAAVRWAAWDKLRAEVDAPAWVTMELAEQRPSGTWLLHLLNYRPEAPVSDIVARLRLPEGAKLKTARLLTPDEAGERKLTSSGHGEAIVLKLPPLKLYQLAVLELEHP